MQALQRKKVTLPMLRCSSSPCCPSTSVSLTTICTYVHTRMCIRPSHPQEYPAGQVLSEGLQNAEDAGASKFAFVLDLRRHAVPGLDPSLQGFSGPAFVLADDRRGFAGLEWESLQHQEAGQTIRYWRYSFHSERCVRLLRESSVY